MVVVNDIRPAGGCQDSSQTNWMSGRPQKPNELEKDIIRLENKKSNLLSIIQQNNIKINGVNM